MSLLNEARHTVTNTNILVAQTVLAPGLLNSDVQSYGAKGNGITDDTAALQNAINSGAANVNLGNGLIYKITAPLTIRSNQCIIGNNSTILRGADIAVMVQNEADGTTGGYDANENMCIQNTKFDANAFASSYSAGGFPTACSALVFGHCKNITLNNVEVFGVEENHCVLFAGVQAACLTKCWFHDCDQTTNDAYAVNMDYFKDATSFPFFGPYDNTVCDNIQLIDNKFDNVAVAAGSLLIDNAILHTDLVVHNCRVNTTAYQGLSVKNWSNVSITVNNLLNTYTSESAASGAAISIECSATPTVTLTDYIVSDNLIDTVGNGANAPSAAAGNGRGINFFGAATLEIQNGTVNDNNIKNCAQHGLSLDNLLNGTVGSNTITGCSGIGLSAFRVNNVSMTGNQATGNNIAADDTYADIVTGGSGGIAPDNSTLTGNQMGSFRALTSSPTLVYESNQVLLNTPLQVFETLLATRSVVIGHRCSGLRVGNIFTMSHTRNLLDRGMPGIEIDVVESIDADPADKTWMLTHGTGNVIEEYSPEFKPDSLLTANIRNGYSATGPASANTNEPNMTLKDFLGMIQNYHAFVMMEYKTGDLGRLFALLNSYSGLRNQVFFASFHQHAVQQAKIQGYRTMRLSSSAVPPAGERAYTDYYAISKSAIPTFEASPDIDQYVVYTYNGGWEFEQNLETYSKLSGAISDSPLSTWLRNSVPNAMHLMDPKNLFVSCFGGTTAAAQNLYPEMAGTRCEFINGGPKCTFTSVAGVDGNNTTNTVYNFHNAQIALTNTSAITPAHIFEWKYSQSPDVQRWLGVFNPMQDTFFTDGGGSGVDPDNIETIGTLFRYNGDLQMWARRNNSGSLISANVAASSCARFTNGDVFYSRFHTEVNPSNQRLYETVLGPANNAALRYGRFVTNATNASPIEITTSETHGLTTGDKIAVYGVFGNTAANNNNGSPSWTVTVVDTTKFTLNGSNGNSTYFGGGRVVGEDCCPVSWSAGSDVIFDASNETPIVITVRAPNHMLVTGNVVTISNVLGNTNANGIWTITKTAGNKFELDGSVGNGVYASPFTGTWNLATSMSVTDASQASPIVITTAVDHQYVTGDYVSISGVGGNTNANGQWQVTVTGATTFSLDGSTQNGAYTAGGTVINGISGTITNAPPNTSTADIVVTSAQNHNLPDNATVTVSGVTGNTKANGTWQVRVRSDTTFQLLGTATQNTGGAYTGGGTFTSSSPNPSSTMGPPGKALNDSAYSFCTIKRSEQATGYIHYLGSDL